MTSYLNKIIESAKYVLRGSTNRKYPDTFVEELEFQCQRLAPVATLLSLFMWLPYLAIDRENYPGVQLLSVVRLGLSGLCILCLAAIFLKPFRFWAITCSTVIVFYIMAGGGAAALLSGGDPAYMGGFFICLTVMPALAPLPIRLMLLALTSTYVLFFAGISLLNIHFTTNSQKYNIRDLITVIILTYVMALIQHRTRRSQYSRAKEIEREKAESNRLLLNILPESIAEELKIRGSTKPIRIEQATVMFTDFVGFTRISEKLAAEEVVQELDKCFSYFDQVTEKYGLEKLKTIGDSFMCAGGLPEVNRTHAIDCCLAALEIQAFMNQMKDIKHQQGFDYWELRLGLNTGPLVAGVVGHKKFAYDVWGDTVNTASRMESSGVPGRINVSATTHRLVKKLFKCSHRGKVKAKNKGEIDMYFLENIHPKYSVKGEGRVPNEAFKALYKDLQS